jgi:hypothetical protein
MYAKEQPTEHTEGAAGEQPKKDGHKDENVVDADFEEVKDEKK